MSFHKKVIQKRNVLTNCHRSSIDKKELMSQNCFFLKMITFFIFFIFSCFFVSTAGSVSVGRYMIGPSCCKRQKILVDMLSEKIVLWLLHFSDFFFYLRTFFGPLRTLAVSSGLRTSAVDNNRWNQKSFRNQNHFPQNRFINKHNNEYLQDSS
jgi:hypothetical protein